MSNRLWTCVSPMFIHFTFLAAATLSSVRGDSLTNQLNAVLDYHSTARRTSVTLKVVDLSNGKVLYDRGGDRLMIPASNLKIYTTACALDTLGPDHRFETIVKVQGSLQDGVLDGNLEFVGGGDAMLTSDDLAAIADRVIEELGIKQIRGKVVVDNSRYASPLKGPGWMWDDEPDYYNMSITPLMVDFNVLEVRLESGKEGMTAKLALPSAYPKIRLVPRRSFGGTKLATRRPFTHPILIAKDGQLEEPKVQPAANDLCSAVEDLEQESPAKDDPSVVRLTMHAPGRWVQGVFTAMLEERGIEFTVPHDDAVPSVDSYPKLLRHKGPTLAETLAHFNKKSENAVGEVMLHEIAIAGGKRRPQWADGAAAITQWLEETAGLEKGSFRLVDGSGLSRYNLITADSSIRLLQFMHQHQHAAEFYSALKRYNVKVDGEQQPLVAAKPGGMGSVSTISGYVDTVEGRRLAFSLLTNGFIGPAKPVFDLRCQVWQILAASGEE